jgi:hypothetical protein
MFLNLECMEWTLDVDSRAKRGKESTKVDVDQYELVEYDNAQRREREGIEPLVGSGGKKHCAELESMETG